MATYLRLFSSRNGILSRAYGFAASALVVAALICACVIDTAQADAPEVLVPYAAHLAPEAARGRVVGNVMRCWDHDCPSRCELDCRRTVLACRVCHLGLYVVLISGFTHPTNEFHTPYRVINYHTCNSCWNDVRLRFDHHNYPWCPRHTGTPRQFECTRLITAEAVKAAIRRIPAFRQRSSQTTPLPQPRIALVKHA